MPKTKKKGRKKVLESKERVLFPEGSFQDSEFEKVFEKYYYGDKEISEHDAYRKAWKDVTKGLIDLRKRKCKIDFDNKQLEIGTKIELEHTKDEKKARQIAKQHLCEYPDYYKSLVKMEEKLEETKPETEGMGDFLKDIKDNKWVFLIAGIAMGGIVAFLITRSYYMKEIAEYKQLLDEQSKQINQLAAQMNRLLGSGQETDTQYLLRRYRETHL